MLKKIVIILFFLILGTLIYFISQNKPTERPNAEQYCFDFAQVLPANLVHEINIQGHGLRKSFDIDFVVAIIPSLKGREIEEYTVDLFSQWEIGRSTQGKKGILILIAAKEQKIKIEVGYDLEEIYPDLYIGQVEREILKEFLEQADWEKGFLATIENFVERIYHLNKKGIDVKEIASTSNDENYSGGAGAKTVFDFGDALSRPLPDNYPAIKAYFSAQPTPELAFQRYMELCAKAVKHNNDLTIFTDLSNKFWQKWSHTSGQMKSEAQDIDGKKYFIKQKDNHAVVFIPTVQSGQKMLLLYFLSESDRGWQVDINTMTRVLRFVGPNWMMMTDTFHPYSDIIMDEYNIVKGFFKRWDDPGGLIPFARLDENFYDESIPGCHIWVMYKELSNLKTGDIVEAIDGEGIRDWNHFWSFFKDPLAGSTFVFKVKRDGKTITVTETLRSYLDGFEDFKKCLETPRRWLGVYLVQSLDMEWEHTKTLRNQGMFQYSSLCYVLDVYPGSPADKAGLKREDLILDYGIPDDNGEIMPWDVTKHLYKLKPGESVELTILRDMKEKRIIKVTPEETNHRGYF